MLRISNPKDKPYGILSNDAFFDIELDGVRWKSVSHYVYANLLSSPMFKIIIRNSKSTKDIYNLYGELEEKELYNTTLQSLNKAHNVKFENQELADILLSTGDKEIIYISENLILGERSPLNPTKSNGYNLLGKSLMELRKTLRRNREKTPNNKILGREDKIYLAYKVYMALEHLLEKELDIKKYRKNSYDEIITLSNIKNFPDKEVVLNLYNTGKLPVIEEEINNPGNLVDIVRRKNIENIQKNINTKRLDIITNMYLEYMLSKNNPEIPSEKYPEVVHVQLSQLDSKQLKDLKQRIEVLFDKGMLSASLSDNIDKELEKLPKSLSDKKVTKILEKPLKTYREITLEENEEEYQPEKELLILYSEPEYNDEEYRPLVPSAIINIDIDNLLFPSVSHYIYANLFSLLNSVKTVTEAYNNYIVNKQREFNTVRELAHIYPIAKQESIDLSLEFFTKKGMDKKFTNTILQDILLSTENMEIQYISNDPVLGINNNDNTSGDNLVGKYLMELRESIIKQRETSGKLIERNDIPELLLKNSLFREWLIMRLQDICRIIDICQQYIMNKYNTNVPINSMFIMEVIEEVYTDCFSVFKEDIDIENIPQEFITLFNNNCKFSKTSDEVIQVLWKYFILIVNYIIKLTPNADASKITKILLLAEKNSQQKRECMGVIQDKKLNCIISALLNIIHKIKRLVEIRLPTMVYSLTEQDIYTAMYILLGVKVNDPSVNKKYIEELTFPEVNGLEFSLKEIDEKVNASALLPVLLSAGHFVKSYDMNKNIKASRINFFSISF